MDASSEFLRLFGHVISAVEVLDGGKRRFSLKEAKRIIEHGVPRMSGSAGWPGYRAQMALPDHYPKNVTPEFFERKKALRPTIEPLRPPSEVAAPNDKVFHKKFGLGIVQIVDGNKLVVDFGASGEKRVIDSFVEKA